MGVPSPTAHPLTRPRLWIGLGTGRCGTRTLAALLDAQPGAAVTHESAPLLPWVPDLAALETRIAALTARGGAFSGDVASSYLPYAGALLAEHPDTRLIVLRRDRGETVRSFERLAGGRNHFVSHARGDWRADPEWDPCFPDYDEPDLRRALLRYWDEYNAQAERLAAAQPERVLVADVPAAFDTEAGVRRVLRHLGVPDAQQVIRTDLHENRGPDAIARLKRAIAHRLRRPESPSD